MSLILLKPDNFTPRARTPWGGTRLVDHYKSELVPPPAQMAVGSAGVVVGESWELSVEPSFPSHTTNGTDLRELLAESPVYWLGAPQAKRFNGQTPLLLKLLDTADSLSVQVHPADDDSALAADESGKPEGWIVLHAEEGSGIYLGFRRGTTRPQVERCLSEGGDLEAMLNFVPVSKGDAFVIAAGTVHAIGAGLTLLEPQFVRPGKRGLTYRYWDWNRLYGPDGKRSEQGAPRELHVKRSLAVSTFDGPQGAEFVEGCRVKGETTPLGENLTRRTLMRWPWFHVDQYRGTGSFTISRPVLSAFTCVGGQATLTTDHALTMERGHTAISAANHSVTVELDEADLFVTWVPDSG